MLMEFCESGDDGIMKADEMGFLGARRFDILFINNVMCYMPRL